MEPTFYLEAELDPNHDISLQEANIELQKVFSDGLIENLMLNLDLCSSDIYEPCFPRYLTSIKAVHYTESDDVTVYYETKDCHIVVNSYRLRDEDDEVAELVDDLSSTHPKLLPIASLEDTWERLIFDRGIKEELVQLATNSLRFKPLNRLILLSGRPGTGKTTLAQALAQKLSIRLNAVFSQTFLLHLRAAALLSQFFGQSAKQIHKIFESISNLSSTNPSILYVLVIDEIESLAGSRSKANAQGEVQDAVRATNELLVGFDTIKNRRNVLIICTSNLLESLDEAFTDRCSKKIVVSPPGAPARYAILRYGLRDLVEEVIITISEDDALPKYEDAVVSREGEYGDTGSRLRTLADSLGSVSARTLGQLPMLALGTYLRPDEKCTLNEAVDLMLRYVRDEGMLILEPAGSIEASSSEDDSRAPTLQIQKRKIEDESHDEHTCACSSKRAKLVGSAGTDCTMKTAIAHEVERQLRPLMEQMEQLEKRLSGEPLVAVIAKPAHEARPLGEMDASALSSRTKKSEKWKVPPWLCLEGQAQTQPIMKATEPPSEQMLLDESPRRPIEQRKKTGDLVEKIETVLCHGDAHETIVTAPIVEQQNSAMF